MFCNLTDNLQTVLSRSVKLFGPLHRTDLAYEVPWNLRSMTRFGRRYSTRTCHEEFIISTFGPVRTTKCTDRCFAPFATNGAEYYTLLSRPQEIIYQANLFYQRGRVRGTENWEIPPPTVRFVECKNHHAIRMPLQFERPSKVHPCPGVTFTCNYRQSCALCCVIRHAVRMQDLCPKAQESLF